MTTKKGENIIQNSQQCVWLLTSAWKKVDIFLFVHLIKKFQTRLNFLKNLSKSWTK